MCFRKDKIINGGKYIYSRNLPYDFLDDTGLLAAKTNIMKIITYGLLW